MKLKLSLIMLFGLPALLYSADSSSTAKTMPTLRWVGFARGNVDSAQILARWPSASMTNYCVILDPQKFDPFNMDRLERPQPKVKRFTDVFLLIDIPAPDTLTVYHLDLQIDLGIPVCTECDGGCAHLQRREVKTYPLELKVPNSNSKRMLLNMRDFVKDWHLVDIKITATVSIAKIQLLNQKIEMGRWPWCL